MAGRRRFSNRGPRKVVLADEEGLFLDYARRLKYHTAGRQAVCLHFSRLQPVTRHLSHIQIALNTLERLVKRNHGQMFKLKNGDVAIVLKNAKRADVNDAIFLIRDAMRSDPLIRNEDDGVEGAPSFCTDFDIAADYDGFLAFAEECAARARAETGDAAATEPAKEAGHNRRSGGSLIDGAFDLEKLCHVETICAMVEGRAPDPLFDHLALHDGALARRFGDAVAGADANVKRRLETVLHTQLLNACRASEEQKRPIAVDITLATALSIEFLQFDRRRADAATGRKYVLCFTLADIRAHEQEFAVAREFLAERGYPLCLTGVGPGDFAEVDAGALGFDLVMVGYEPHLPDAEFAAALRAGLSASKRARIILTHCVNDAPVRLGMKLGIPLFAGSYVSEVLEDLAAQTMPAASASASA